MVDRPILFSAPMVRALIREARQPGTGKTQTRRIIKGDVPMAPGLDDVHPAHEARHSAPYLDAYCGAPRTSANPRGMSDRWCWWTRDDRPGPQFVVPFVPGDRLWVRETWQTGSGCAGPQLALKATDDAHDIDGWDGLDEGAGRSFNYDRFPGMRWHTWLPDLLSGVDGEWRPSIFMPRWASRLTLHVTDVRIERLQDISEADAIAEGIFRIEIGSGYPDRFAPTEVAWSDVIEQQAHTCLDPREAYRDLWNGLHGIGAWSRNPWLVAVTVRPVLANIGAESSAMSAAA